MYFNIYPVNLQIGRYYEDLYKLDELIFVKYKHSDIDLDIHIVFDL